MKKSLLIGCIKSISLIMLSVLVLSGCKKDEMEDLKILS